MEAVTTSGCVESSRGLPPLSRSTSQISYVYVPAGSGPKRAYAVVGNGGGPIRHPPTETVVRTTAPLTTVEELVPQRPGAVKAARICCASVGFGGVNVAGPVMNCEKPVIEV